jgi:hypothetical protein
MRHEQIITPKTILIEPTLRLQWPQCSMNRSSLGGSGA